MIFCAITGPMPGRESRSSELAALMSIRPPLLVAADGAEAAFPDFVAGVVWAAVSVTAVKKTKNHRLKSMKAILTA